MDTGILPVKEVEMEDCETDNMSTVSITLGDSSDSEFDSSLTDPEWFPDCDTVSESDSNTDSITDLEFEKEVSQKNWIDIIEEGSGKPEIYKHYTLAPIRLPKL